MSLKIDPAFKARLLGAKKALSTGFFIDKKNFTSGTYRLLSFGAGDNKLIAKEYVSFWCDRLKLGSTSPITFGLRCPIVEFFDQLKNNGKVTKDERDAYFKSVKRSNEYWMVLIDPTDLGTAERPNLRGFRSTRSIYMDALQRMTDDNIGEDVTSLTEGRPAYITKTGSKLDTEWRVTWMDRAPICDDEEFIQSLDAIMADFDIAAKFYAVKWDNIAKFYEELTGEKMPDHYRNQEGADAGAAEEGGGDDAAVGVPSRNAAPAPVATGPKKSGPTKASPPPADVREVGMRTRFMSEGVEVLGEIVEITGDVYAIRDSSGDTWECKAEDFEIVEDAPAAPTGPKKSKSPAQAAPAEVPAKGAASKPAPAATGTKLPAKPASSGMRARLSK